MLSREIEWKPHPFVVTDPVSLKSVGIGLKYFTCTEIYTKAIQACKVSDGPSSLNMCKIPKALWKTCFSSTDNTEIFVSLHKNVYHALNWNCMASIKIISFLLLLQKQRLILSIPKVYLDKLYLYYFLPLKRSAYGHHLIKIICKNVCDHDRII